MSLIEVLVATAVMAVAIIIALTVYDAARKTFKKGENATEQQETVRIAYDRLTADLRMLGYNANPDGNVTRPDEKLEVGLDHAIIFRGDFDVEDPGKVNDVEGAFAGGAFDVVSTGNDEVVGYVLSKPDPATGNPTGGDTITFDADVNDSPRDGVVTTVTINKVVLNPTNPPYDLYKISLNNDTGTCCNNDFIVRTKVAENVRNLTFQYFNPSSTAPLPVPGALETTAAKATRASITKFNVSLIGMTKDPDMSYNDTADAAAQRYRKFELRGDVVPRNMKMVGRQDLAADTVPPTKPATPSLIPGHCGGLIVTWAANSPSDGVNQYRINYGTTAGSPSGFKGGASSPYFLDALTTGTLYYVSIQAIDGAGNTSIKSNEANATVTNTNTPTAPGSPGASAGTNFVRLNWTATTTNTANVPAADPIAPAIRDLKGYRVYRGDTSAVVASGTPYAGETVVSGAVPPWDDTAVVNCHTYHYKMTAVDACGTASAATGDFTGASTTSTPPMAPTNVQAFVAGPGKATVSWSAVTKDTGGNNIFINAYDVYRSPVMLKTDTSSPVFGGSPIATVVGALTYPDVGVPSMPPLQTVYYMVKAKDECVNYSDPSSTAQLTCAFTGTVAITAPADGAIVAGVTPVTVTISGGSDVYTGAVITYTHSVSGLTRTFTATGVGPTWQDTGWLATPAGAYTITATVANASGCTSTVSISVNAGSSVGCCLSMYPTTNTIASCSNGSAKCKEVSYRIGNDRCLTAVSILAMTVSWVDYGNLHPRWVNAQFNGINMAAAGSWTATYVGAINEVGLVTKTGGFASPTPQVPYATPMTGINTTNVTYFFTDFMDNKIGPTRYVNVIGTNQYQFTLLDSAGVPSGITTTCNMPSLTVN
jgi:hypothetical protein